MSEEEGQEEANEQGEAEVEERDEVEGVEHEEPEAGVDVVVEETDEGLEPGRVPGVSVDVRTRIRGLASGAWANLSGAGGGLRQFVLPAAVFLTLVVLMLLFHEILMPFILALVIVYLMDPIVSRVAVMGEERRGLPRWAAVIAVYLTFFGVVTTSLVLIAPRFVTEIVRFGETVPEDLQEFRTKQLPEYNAKLQGALAEYMPQFAAVEGVSESARVEEAWLHAAAALNGSRTKAAGVSTAVVEARRVVQLSTRMKVRWSLEGDPAELTRAYKIERDARTTLELASAPRSWTGGSWGYAVLPDVAQLRVVPSKAGGYEVFIAPGAELEVAKEGDEAWRVRRAPGAEGPLAEPEVRERLDLTELLDLELVVDGLIEDAVHSSRAQFAKIIGFAQRLVVGIISAFVGLMLTLMVAAFISIDLPGLIAFFRGLFREEYHERFDALLGEMDRGLSGVVRGQLLICLVNGTLTYVGLMILNVKFALLLAVVAGVLSVIPIFGTILSTVPIVLFGLTDGLAKGFAALMWILFIHFIEANLLNPKIIGSSAHIHPVIVIFALLAGESAFGLVGALLAVPTTSILLTLFRFFIMRTERAHAAPEVVQGDAASAEGARSSRDAT